MSNLTAIESHLPNWSIDANCLFCITVHVRTAL